MREHHTDGPFFLLRDQPEYHFIKQPVCSAHPFGSRQGHRQKSLGDKSLFQQTSRPSTRAGKEQSALLQTS